jgi:hypothetical protein
MFNRAAVKFELVQGDSSSFARKCVVVKRKRVVAENQDRGQINVGAKQIPDCPKVDTRNSSKRV